MKPKVAKVYTKCRVLKPISEFGAGNWYNGRCLKSIYCYACNRKTSADRKRSLGKIVYPPKSVALVVMRRGPGQKGYHAVDWRSTIVAGKGIDGTRGIRSEAVELERRLNVGMIAEEAELAFPRLGLHNKAIFKVKVRPAKN